MAVGQRVRARLGRIRVLSVGVPNTRTQEASDVTINERKHGWRSRQALSAKGGQRGTGYRTSVPLVRGRTAPGRPAHSETLLRMDAAFDSMMSHNLPYKKKHVDWQGICYRVIPRTRGRLARGSPVHSHYKRSP